MTPLWTCRTGRGSSPTTKTYGNRHWVSHLEALAASGGRHTSLRPSDPSLNKGVTQSEPMLIPPIDSGATCRASACVHVGDQFGCTDEPARFPPYPTTKTYGNRHWVSHLEALAASGGLMARV
jgi:hypothetical protein